MKVIGAYKKACIPGIDQVNYDSTLCFLIAMLFWPKIGLTLPEKKVFEIC